MNLIFVPDSFKGSLSSAEAISILTRCAKKVFKKCRTAGILTADGGEGTLEAVEGAVKDAKYVYPPPVKNPSGKDINARYLVYGDTAVIVMAEASGLTLIPESQRNPMLTSTYGTGQLIAHALKAGYRKITVGIGGSATNDGGTGAMAALGVKFFGGDKRALDGRGENLIKIRGIDVSGLMNEARRAQFTVMCDVTNTFTGQEGATYVFGRQKGADEDMLAALEKGMLNYKNALFTAFNKDADSVTGGGAAGGLGAALSLFLNAKMRPGIDVILDSANFDELLEGADLVVTGEGRIDGQSAYGKVVSGIGRRCAQKNVPVAVIAGSIGKGASALYKHGISAMFATVNAPMPLSFAIENAKELYAQAAENVFRLFDAAQKK